MQKRENARAQLYTLLLASQEAATRARVAAMLQRFCENVA